MKTRPYHPNEATIAKAANLVRQGRWPEAEQLLGQVLGADPREPDGLQLLGLVREQQDRRKEAELLLRRSLALRPEQPHVQVHLGRVLARMGRHPEAIDLLQAAALARPDLFDAFLLLAQVQVTTGQFALAEKNYRAALRLAPKSGAALLGLGVLLNQTNRPAEGETVLRIAAETLERPAPSQARILYHLGVSLELQGRPEEAIDAWRHAVARDPLNKDAHRELNALLYRLGRDGAFLASYDDAMRRVPLSRAPKSGMPDSGQLMLQKADFFIHAERFEEARDCFARLAALAPGSAGPQNGLAVAFAGLGQWERAIAAYEKSLKLQPGDLATQVRLACVLLRSGDAARALRLTEAVVPQMKFDQATLAVHELALRANNDARAESLADYARHIRIFDLDAPAGFCSMADFNAALNAHLDTMHTDRREPIEQTLRHGTQTAPSLLAGRNALLQALRLRIEEAVCAYIAGMPHDAEHPLAGRRAKGFAFAGSWSSRLRDCGFHTNHVHPKGWISSAYYIALPDSVTDANTREGWIQFGAPDFEAGLKNPVRRVEQPAPGKLVLFPSYMWHGTIPFHSQQSRTTIAFDVVPR